MFFTVSQPSSRPLQFFHLTDSFIFCLTRETEVLRRRFRLSAGPCSSRSILPSSPCTWLQPASPPASSPAPSALTTITPLYLCPSSFQVDPFPVQILHQKQHSSLTRHPCRYWPNSLNPPNPTLLRHSLSQLGFTSHSLACLSCDFCSSHHSCYDSWSRMLPKQWILSVFALLDLLWGYTLLTTPSFPWF